MSEPSIGELDIINDSEQVICFIPIHPASAPAQERDLLRLLGEDHIEPRSRRRFSRGEVPLLNVEGTHRLTLVTCDGQASPVERIDFAVGAIVTIETF
jgi:hypothetical protein